MRWFMISECYDEIFFYRVLLNFFSYYELRVIYSEDIMLYSWDIRDCYDTCSVQEVMSD
jgi:hypothetical protein